MKIVFLPQTYVGKWSLRLIVALLIFLSLLSLFAIFGQTFHENPWLLIPIFIIYSSAISSFVVGLISILKKGEKSFLVYVAINILI